MADIIEQAARVIDRATSYTGSALSTDAQQAAQALADAGLLREARTVPTREQIAAVFEELREEAWPEYVGPEDYTNELMSLLHHQPTVADVRLEAIAEERIRNDNGTRIPAEALLDVNEVKARALEQAATQMKHRAARDFLRHRAQQYRDQK